MAKVLSRYLALPSEYFTPTNIKNRSSDVGDETVNGNNLDVTNDTTTDIKNALGQSHHRVFDLWHSPNVNKYSKFGTYTRLVITGELKFNTPVSTSPGLMGDFVGYNHNAIVPECTGTNWSDGGSYNKTVCAGETAYFTANSIIHLGEIDWAALKSNISYMNVQFTNSNMSVIYGTSANFTLNTSTFTKTDSDLYVSMNKTLSSTTYLNRTYYLSYHFYDSSNNELIHTGVDERPSFTVQYVFVDYTVNTPLIETNTKFDEIAYTSYSIIENGSSSTLTYYDIVTKENGSCVNERVQIYLAYPDSTAWEKYTCDTDFECSPTGNYTIQLEDRLSCTTALRIKFYPYNILDCPATRPF